MAESRTIPSQSNPQISSIKQLQHIVGWQVFLLTDLVETMPSRWSGETHIIGETDIYKQTLQSRSPSSECPSVHPSFHSRQFTCFTWFLSLSLFSFFISSITSCSCSTITWGSWPGKTMPLNVLVAQWHTCFLCVVIKLLSGGRLASIVETRKPFYMMTVSLYFTAITQCQKKLSITCLSKGYNYSAACRTNKTNSLQHLAPSWA